MTVQDKVRARHLMDPGKGKHALHRQQLWVLCDNSMVEGDAPAEK